MMVTRRTGNLCYVNTKSWLCVSAGPMSEFALQSRIDVHNAVIIIDEVDYGACTWLRVLSSMGTGWLADWRVS